MDDDAGGQPTPSEEAALELAADAVARPSPAYRDMSFEMGKQGYPAIAMTHFAAAKFCQWLSARTGHYYRLPTEAEWEYACRAGTETTYSFGDDVAELGEYAWYLDNSDGHYHKVGRKKPNPWGLYDLHGNVKEWCIDQLSPDYSWLGVGTNDPVLFPTAPYPHVVRGGSYDDPSIALRCGARSGSDASWKMTDPNLPKGAWWLSDARTIGLRIVRPLELPDVETLARYWHTGTERE
jgi:formylglycine-generating enzyme required for sulfatase activity